MSKYSKKFFDKKKEWSKTKDAILGCYLVPYFQKILTAHKPLCYIDCFAGKGKFKDGEVGSPIIALNALSNSINTCKKELNNEINCYFIELKYGSELQNNLKSFDDEIFKYEVISGKFEDNYSKLLEKHSLSNLFLYIDPYGIKSLNANAIRSILDFTKNIELLINVNTWSILRNACRVLNTKIEEDYDMDSYTEEIESSDDIVSEEIDRAVGSHEWADVIKQYKINRNIVQAEYKISKIISKSLDNYQYVLNVPIYKDADNNKVPKYRLYHLTNHRDGCILMGNTMFKKFHEANKIQNNYQEALFQYSCNREIVDDKIIENHILSIISKDKQHLNDILANYYTNFGLDCSISKLNKILLALEKTNNIYVDRLPNITQTGKPSKFMSEDRYKKVLIWK